MILHVAPLIRHHHLIIIILRLLGLAQELELLLALLEGHNRLQSWQQTLFFKPLQGVVRVGEAIVLGGIGLARLVHGNRLRVRTTKLVAVRVVEHDTVLSVCGHSAHFRAGLLDHIPIGFRDCRLLVKNDLIEFVAG